MLRSQRWPVSAARLVAKVDPAMRTAALTWAQRIGAALKVSLGVAAPVAARAPIDPNAKLQCVSYAPFRGAQTPLVPTTQISPEQIAQDLAQLAKVTDCVRTYSVDLGLDRVGAGQRGLFRHQCRCRPKRKSGDVPQRLEKGRPDPALGEQTA